MKLIKRFIKRIIKSVDDFIWSDEEIKDLYDNEY